MKRKSPTSGSTGAAPSGRQGRRLSAEGTAAWAHAVEAWARRGGTARAERAALSLEEAVSREHGVRALFAPAPSGAEGMRLAAGAAGEAREVLLRALPGGQFLLRGEGSSLVLEWTGPGRPTLESSAGWTAERTPRPRGQPLRWTLRRTGRARPAKRLPVLRARVGGRWWPLVHPS